MKPKKKTLSNAKGFTLLEILVVLTVMGFLIAMVAPRLAGISNSAVDTVCDTNQNRTIQMAAAYFEKTGKFPNKLTNLVVTEGVDATAANNTYYTPSVSDDDPDNGQETLSSEFDERVKPTIHVLSSDEVDELADMGITKVFNLNSYDNFTTDGDKHNLDGGSTKVATVAPPMLEVTLAEGMGVMMSGIGVTTGNDFKIYEGGVELSGYGEAEFLGRIVFGFGPENGLITSGLITNAAHCPGGIQNSDNITYNDYNLVVPRLQATVDREEGMSLPILTDAADAVSNTQYIAYGYAEDYSNSTVSSTYNTDTGVHAADSISAAGVKARTLNFTAQELYKFATMCPEGHMYPADDSDFWAVDLNATGGTGSVTVN